MPGGPLNIVDYYFWCLLLQPHFVDSFFVFGCAMQRVPLYTSSKGAAHKLSGCTSVHATAEKNCVKKTKMCLRGCIDQEQASQLHWLQTQVRNP